MSDVISPVSTPAQWQSYVLPIAKLFSAQPISQGARVLVMLASADAQSAIQAAVAAAGGVVVAVDTEISQGVVAQEIERIQPDIVVCVPEVFGWVSKMAFLARTHAVFTCGAVGEGTLIDRAQHYAKGQ